MHPRGALWAIWRRFLSRFTRDIEIIFTRGTFAMRRTGIRR